MAGLTMGRKRKLPDLGLVPTIDSDPQPEWDAVEQEPQTDEELGLTTKQVVRLEAFEGGAPEPRRSKATLRELAARYRIQAINALARKLHDRDSRVVVTAANSLLARSDGQPAIEGKGSQDAESAAEAVADITTRLAAIEARQNDPTYLSTTLAIMQGANIVKDPNATVEPELTTEEEVAPPQLVLEPPPAPAIEVEVIHEECFCEHPYDVHPRGAGCSQCSVCTLYSARSDAIEFRRNKTDDE